MRNLDNPVNVVYHELPPTPFTVPAGAAGWIDTDVSAHTDTIERRIWLVYVAGIAGATNKGVRKHGSAIDTHVNTALSSFVAMVSVDATGHVDLYREPTGDNVYIFQGYLV